MLIKSWIWKLLNYLSKYIAEPRMIVGYKRHDKVYLKTTRISNTTSIVGKQNFNIAENVFIGHFNLFDASNGLTIEEGCQFANYISVLTHSSHLAIRLYGASYIQNNGRHVGYQKGSSVIGKYSFIGPHCVIMPGVTLGKGSLITAYSYVKAGTYPDFAILAGNPAQIIGDSRSLDRPYLESDVVLQRYYAEWSEQ